MKKLGLFFAHSLSLLSIFYMAVLPSNKYSWMREIEPTLQTLPEDPNARQRYLIFWMLFISVIIIQGLLLIVQELTRSETKKRESKVTSLALKFVALGTLIFKIWAMEG